MALATALIKSFQSLKIGYIILALALLPDSILPNFHSISSVQKECKEHMRYDSNLIDQDYLRSKLDSSLIIKNVRIVDHKLKADIEYEGGCKNHNFQLFTDGMIMETCPVQIRVFLIPD